MTGFRALLVEKTETGFQRSVVTRRVEDLPPGDLLIDVRYSSLNFKDALSATGNPGVSRNFPHTPGIDAAGVVVESSSEGFAPGDAVVAIGALIRGDTAHFDVLASVTTSALNEVMQATAVPVGFGVLTCDSMEQAVARAGAKGGNRGWDAALAATRSR